MMANAVSRHLFMKTNAAVRYGMVHLLSSTVPLYVVNEFPKSGGSWTSQMLSEALGVPFPRNRFPSLRPSIIQGHFLSPWGMKNVLVVWRDGRDVMVSWYHHCLFKNERHNSFLVDAVRGDLQLDDYSDVRGNLPAFIEYAFTRHRHPRFTWAGFANRWHGRRDVVYTRYEFSVFQSTRKSTVLMGSRFGCDRSRIGTAHIATPHPRRPLEASHPRRRERRRPAALCARPLRQ